jgi:hypothetical protein
MACFRQARSAAGFIWREAIGPKPPWAMRTTKRVYPCGLWGGGGAGVADTEHVGRTWGERVRRGGGRRESRAWRELGMVKVNRSTGPCRRPSSIHTSTQPLLAYRRSCFPHRRATVPGRRSPRSPRHFSRDPACLTAGPVPPTPGGDGNPFPTGSAPRRRNRKGTSTMIFFLRLPFPARITHSPLKRRCAELSEPLDWARRACPIPRL